MKLKRKFALLMVLVVILGSLAACGGSDGNDDASTDGESPADSGYISIATGGTGGTYYPLGGALAKILNDSDLGIQANAQATGASVENIELISSGSAEVAFVQNDTSYYAFEGTELFEEKGAHKDIRGIATLYPEVVQIIAHADSGINTVADLVGKKVAVGAPGSGTEVTARQILSIYGIEYDDLDKVDYLSFSEATDHLKSNQVDAAFVTAAIPSSSVTELATTHDIKLVEVSKDKAEELIASYPYYTAMDIVTDEYKGIDEPVPAVAVQAMLIVNENMDEELAYNITKALFDNLDVLEASHARGKDVTLESALDGMSIELHPGAQKFFDEKGISK